MQVKTFTGSSNKEVLDMIKAALGSEAVILDTRTSTIAGNRVITMTAALERDDVAPESSADQRSSGPPPGMPGLRGGLFGPAGASIHGGSVLPKHFLDEWNSIKNHLFALMKPALNLERLSKSQRAALEYLQREGANDQVILELYRKLSRNPEEPVLGPLGSMLPVKPWGAERWPQRVHLVAGPYGAGKTTTAVRMALACVKSRGARFKPPGKSASSGRAAPVRASMPDMEFEDLLTAGYGSAGRHEPAQTRRQRAYEAADAYGYEEPDVFRAGREQSYGADLGQGGGRVCIVNADAERGNGRLLLKHYAGLSGFAYREAGNAMEMRGVLSEIAEQDFDRVIVDLPGLPKGAYMRDLAASLGLYGKNAIKTAMHLVLPPHYDDSLALALLDRYYLDLPGSLVWSKLDEFSRYGSLLNVALASGLPISCLSFGPGLLNTLLPATQVMLWRLIFKHELPVNCAPAAYTGAYTGEHYE